MFRLQFYLNLLGLVLNGGGVEHGHVFDGDALANKTLTSGNKRASFQFFARQTAQKDYLKLCLVQVPHLTNKSLVLYTSGSLNSLYSIELGLSEAVNHESCYEANLNRSTIDSSLLCSTFAWAAARSRSLRGPAARWRPRETGRPRRCTGTWRMLTSLIKMSN